MRLFKRKIDPRHYVVRKVRKLTDAYRLELEWGPAESVISIKARWQAGGTEQQADQRIVFDPCKPFTLDQLDALSASLGETLNTLKNKIRSLDRQVSGSFDRIRVDHLNRYMFAKDLAKGPVLDAACGVGYGSFILAEHGFTVTAVDIDRDSIAFGQDCYGHGNIQWTIGDLLEKPWGEQKFKTIVSMETLEHLKEPEKALTVFKDSLEPDGKLICSVPNEEQYPFIAADYASEQYPHQRHYTPKEFEDMLNVAGFFVIYRGTQLSKIGTVVNGSGGKFLIYTCEHYQF